MKTVTDHFRTIWARTRARNDSIEAAGDSRFHLESPITERTKGDMEELMLNDRNIAEVSKSREDLNVDRVDEVSHTAS
jgi:hypothetical protein